MKYKKEDFIMVDWKKIALFAGGTLFGTAGVKILASDDAKKVYTPVSYTHLDVYKRQFLRNGR